MNVMRYTVIDDTGTVSFVAHCEYLPAMVAACAAGAGRLDDLLAHIAKRDTRLREFVSSGLAVFDEHNTPEALGRIHAAIATLPSHEQPTMRVVDDVTQEASLRGAKAGVVVFNLSARRIIQIQNTYAEIRRMSNFVHRLEKNGWSIVP